MKKRQTTHSSEEKLPGSVGKPSIDKKKRIREIRPLNFLFLTLAGIINAFGVTLFLFPVKLYDSGMSGTSMLLDQITPSFLTLPMFLVLLNVPIFIFGYRKQGLPFTVLRRDGSMVVSHSCSGFISPRPLYRCRV